VQKQAVGFASATKIANCKKKSPRREALNYTFISLPEISNSMVLSESYNAVAFALNKVLKICCHYEKTDNSSVITPILVGKNKKHSYRRLELTVN
jgi:hypothetical protein